MILGDFGVLRTCIRFCEIRAVCGWEWFLEGKLSTILFVFGFWFLGYGLVRRYINAVRVVASFISSRTKQRTMSQDSQSLGDEPIQPTQSVEHVLETETQEELPETQDSVTNYDIFEYDDNSMLFIVSDFL